MLNAILSHAKLRFQRAKIPLRVFIFRLVLGAVPREDYEIRVTRFRDLSTSDQQDLSELLGAIDATNHKRLWPARFTIRFIDGMSGQSFRQVLNQLLSNRNSYLEVGTFKGSTGVSATFGNQVDGYFIDDWSEFDGPASNALRNLSRAARSGSNLSIISGDFKTFDFRALIRRPVDVYFFDGPHSVSDHQIGAEVIHQLTFERLLFIVDDWNWEQVRIGTKHGLAGLAEKLIFRVEIFSTSKRRFRFSRWHNGYAFFGLRS
jgi:hypothetical protein